MGFFSSSCAFPYPFQAQGSCSSARVCIGNRISVREGKGPLSFCSLQGLKAVSAASVLLRGEADAD